MESKLSADSSIAILGAGSAGIRHSKKLSELGFRPTIYSRRNDAEEFSQRMKSSNGWADFDHLIVALETASHLPMLLNLANSKFQGKVLVEKPGLITMAHLDQLRGLDVQVAYNLRYLEGLRYVTEEMRDDQTISAAVVCHSNLKNWREDWNRQGQYSKSAALGGGVLFDLSHEIDYFLGVFGEPQGLAGFGGRFGDVTTDADDTWKVAARFDQGYVVSIDLSFVSHHEERKFQVNQAGKSLSIDLRSGLVEDSRSGHIQFNAPSSTTSLMLSDWLATASSRLPTLEQNMKTLSFIDKLRRLEVGTP